MRRFLRICAAPAFLAGACLLAACGGGGGGGTPPAGTTAPIGTPSPVGAISASPTSLAFIATGAGAAQTLSATEPGYGGVLSVDGTTCSGIVTTAVGSAAGQFLVTPVAAGQCSLKITDASGNSVSVPVTVTVTDVSGQ